MLLEYVARNGPAECRPNSVLTIDVPSAVLADSADRCMEAVPTVRGIKLLGCITELVDAGRATAKAERTQAGGRPIDVNRIQTTIAGRVALAGAR